MCGFVPKSPVLPVAWLNSAILACCNNLGVKKSPRIRCRTLCRFVGVKTVLTSCRDIAICAVADVLNSVDRSQMEKFSNAANLWPLASRSR